MRVLYVEDSRFDADLTRHALARQAPEIALDIAGSVAGAREHLAEARYDLVLTDLKLPDGTGLELLATLRSDGLDVPVVLVTGQGDLATAVNALKAGVHDYVVKDEAYLDHLAPLLREVLTRTHRHSVRGRPLRVLYAEPNAADAGLARRHLARHAPHLALTVVGDANAVLAALSNDDVRAHDVLLLDYRLPGMDGLELLRVLRSRFPATLPIVLTTAQGSEVMAAQALHLGVDDFLPKHEGYLYALPATLEKVHRENELMRERDTLRALAERHAQLLAASPTLTYRMRFGDAQKRTMWVSENVERMLGYAVEEVLADGWWQNNLYAEDRGQVMAAQQDLASRDMLDLTYRFRHKDGHLLWIRDQQRLLRDAQGQPGEIVGTWSDVTDEAIAIQVHRARMALRELVLDGRPLTDILACCVRWMEDSWVSQQTAILLVDPHGQEMIPTATGKLGDDYARCVVTHSSALLSALCEAQPQDAFTADLDIATAADDCWHALTRAAGERTGRHLPLVGSNGRILGVLAVYGEVLPQRRDEVRNRRLAEFAQIATLAAEHSEEEQIRRQAFTALADTRDGIVITDLSPAIVSVNSAWTEITGYAEDEVRGRNPSLLKSGMEPPERYQEMWQTLLDTGTWQGELWNRRKNGETYPQLLSISTVRAPDGTPTHYVGVMTDLSRLRHSEAEKERLTHFDPLTHLPNRLLAMSRLQHAIEQADRLHENIAVLCLDLDFFQHINDSLGPVIGDHVLAQVGERLRKRLRHGETLARLGGDEFLVVVERLGIADDAARLARELLDALREPILVDGGQSVFTGGSIGISIYPHDATEAHALVQHADTALNQAKTLGRGQYCFYTQSMGERVRQRLQLENHLRRALEHGELSLHYQPQVDIRSGLINGIEALMRWHSPTLGEVSPTEFIPVAEQSGLIFPLGRWALEEACRQNKRWQNEGLPQLCVAVNVSVRQFHHPDLIATVSAALAASNLPPRCLEIELTESAFVANAEAAIRTSQQLHDLGVKLSLDDFGTGYSSLTYLSRFPFDKIKIDQSFVRDITSNPTNAAIANATIALADSLHMAVLAEGVETESQLGFLRQRGCNSMQGYLFSRPLPPEQFAALLREARTLPAGPAAQEAPRTLLLVDDEANILRALQRLLRQDGYRILATTSAAEAFELLAQNAVQVIVSDQRMPEMNGTEFLSRVKELYPNTIRIVLSGYSEVETITQAVNRGAIYKFFTKPWDDAELRKELREAFRVAEKALG